MRFRSMCVVAFIGFKTDFLLFFTLFRRVTHIEEERESTHSSVELYRKSSSNQPYQGLQMANKQKPKKKTHNPNTRDRPFGLDFLSIHFLGLSKFNFQTRCFFNSDFRFQFGLLFQFTFTFFYLPPIFAIFAIFAFKI